MECSIDGDNCESNKVESKDQSSKASFQDDLSSSMEEENVTSSVGISLSNSKENESFSNHPDCKIKSKDCVPTLQDGMVGEDDHEVDHDHEGSSNDHPHSHNLDPCTEENGTAGEKGNQLPDLVDSECDRNVEMEFDLGNDESYSNECIDKNPSNGTEKSQILELIERPEQPDNNQLEVDNSINDVEINASGKQIDSRPTVDPIVKDFNNDKQMMSSATESAFKKLASLGVIAQETQNCKVESKESVLQKLASRGSISVTAASGLPIISSGPNTTLPKKIYKPGPMSSKKKQQTKKIKIDPGKSMDIDEDFSSLINILSTGDSALQPNVTLHGTSYLEKNSSNELTKDRMDLDAIEDHSVHDSDSESHDGNKSVSQGSDHSGEREESVIVTHCKLKNVIEEGSAEILLSATKNVFYNKVQEFNRDMSIAALTVFSEIHQQDPRTRNRGKKRKAAEDISENSELVDDNIFEPGKKSERGITILEALSATGLRSIRYAREIPGVKEVTANDLSEDAVETIRKNIEHNGVGDMVKTTMSDASLLMYQQQTNQQWYDAIDLDPYGCPSRFLDSAVQAVRDGGLLLVTCTDMAVLAGNSPETCYVKYGAVSLRSPSCHEMALRIALQCIESHANRYGRYIVPLVSFSADFYIRLIVQIYTSPVTCKKTTSKLSMVYQCVGCQTHTLQPLGQMSQPGPSSQPKFSLPSGPPVDINCAHCNHKHTIGGPIWSAPIYSSKFVESMLNIVETGKFATSKRMQGMLEVIREELPDTPLYYTVAGLCTRLHCQAIPLVDVRSAILNTGYKVSSSHAAPTAIKTNAPAKIIWDIMRCWVHMNPVSQKRLVAGSVPAAIILEPPAHIANFDIHPKARPSSSMRKLLRYQPNPEKNWGPGMRAKCNLSDDSAGDKSKMNQNKNKIKSGPKNIDIIEVVTIDDEDDIMDDTSAVETAATIASSAS